VRPKTILSLIVAKGYPPSHLPIVSIILKTKTKSRPCHAALTDGSKSRKKYKPVSPVTPGNIIKVMVKTMAKPVKNYQAITKLLFIIIKNATKGDFLGFF
jgi:hypothetical protein